VRRIVALALAGLGAATGCKHRPPPRAYTVTIENFAFKPATLIVAPGDTVVWKNGDFVPHTSTARDHAWDSKNIDGSGTYRFVAAAPGTHAYYCVYHPTMQGTLEVR
jgi:plastocyanin